MISCTMTKILCRKFFQKRKNVKKDLQALPPHKFFHVYIKEGYTGVFLWSMISCFSVKREFRKFIILSDSWCMKNLNFLPFFMILPLYSYYTLFWDKSSEWLEPSIESDLGMQFAIWTLGLCHLRFCFLRTLFLEKCSNLICRFSWFRKMKCWYL